MLKTDRHKVPMADGAERGRNPGAQLGIDLDMFFDLVVQL